MTGRGCNLLKGGVGFVDLFCLRFVFTWYLATAVRDLPFSLGGVSASILDFGVFDAIVVPFVAATPCHAAGYSYFVGLIPVCAKALPGPVWLCCLCGISFAWYTPVAKRLSVGPVSR